MNVLPIAALQCAPIVGDRAGTLDLVRRRVLTVAAAFPHVRLVVLPELLLCAEPAFGEPAARDPRQLAEPIPGPTTEALAELAREAGVWLVPGSLYEAAADEHVYNTAPVFDARGELVTVYRKIFPWHPFEATAPGSEFVVFDFEGVARIGLAVCFDGTFPEMFRQLAWLGADIVLQPTLTPTRDRTQELVIAQANAIVNQVWVVSLNGAAPVGAGESVIVDPEGIVRQRAGGGEEILVEAVDLDAVQRARRFGAAGTTRPWALLANRPEPLELPAYGGALRAPEWAATLKEEQ